jgi:pyruvate/2-oxoglutarate dehydrogenase complex dihydrolipoamide acyltransferase (E2) component
VVGVGAGAASALASDEAPNAGGLPTIGFDWWPRSAPTIPREVFEPVLAPPVLTTTPGVAELVAPVDVDEDVEPDPVDVAPVDVDEDVEPDPVDVPVPVDEPAEVFADPEPEPLADDPDDPDDPDDVEDDPPDAGAAQATPPPVKTAAPTPSATASPPIRPIYREAPIASSWVGDGSQSGAQNVQNIE